MIPRDMVRKVATAYSAERGQTGLAEELGVADRTFRRWVAGDMAVPMGIAERLVPILLRRAAELEGQAGECRTLAEALKRIAADEERHCATRC